MKKVHTSSRNQKAVLLHDWNSFSFILIGHLVHMKEAHKCMNRLLSVVNYQKHKWLICGDFKVVGMVLRLQGMYTKYPCFLWLWDMWADDQHYVRQEWPLRQGLKFGAHNNHNNSLVEMNKILLPPLHIKLGVIKDFEKGIEREGSGFVFL